MPQAQFYQVNALPAGIGVIPKNAIALRATFDFTADGAIQSADLGGFQMRATEWFQSVYIDNSANAGTVDVAFDGSVQTVHCPGFCAGWFPVLALNPPKITVTNPYARGRCRIFLCNFPRELTVANNNGQGNLNVMQNPSVTGGVDTAVPQYSTGSKNFGNTAAAGSINLVFTGSNLGQTFYVTTLHLVLSGDAAQAVAGQWVVQIRSSTTVLAEFGCYLPNASVAAPLGNIVLASIDDWKMRNTIVGGTLNVNLPVALTAGRLYYNIGAGVTQLG